ncbi:MAG TPA: histidine phosphatase family protein [Acidimicrobiales bacterium]|nr:histidine phosphatase family protein [Acidimicrobiales bacterium]
MTGAAAPTGPDQPNEYRQHRFEAPPGATELLIVRHGESAPARPDDPFPLVDGHGDPPLAPEGREEAERVGERLALERIDAVYVTSLRRTRETAEPLARRSGLPIRVEAGLREVFLGEWEGGLFRKMVADGHPAALRMMAEQRWDAIPGAESGEALEARVAEALGRIVAAHPDGRVAVFTHGGVIAEILRQATGCRPFAFLGADNGSVTHVVATEGRWVVRRFNDTAHLERTFTLAPEPLT